MTCKICKSETKSLFEATLLEKHTAVYSQCTQCGFVQPENPHWLEEAYQVPINLTDTGILARNLNFSQIVSTLIYFLFDRNGKFLDYAGGYGIFTRLMRDIGFDYHWIDPHTSNLVARGFEWNDTMGSPVLLTSFESFEHFVDPMAEVAKMVAISKTIIFSTELLPSPVPAPTQWWYYGLEHGQHVSFYTPKSLERLASNFGLRYLTDGNSLHMFTDKPVSPSRFKLLVKLARRGLFRWVRRRMQGKTMEDMDKMIARLAAERA